MKDFVNYKINAPGKLSGAIKHKKMNTTKEKLAKYEINSDALKRQIVFSLFRILGKIEKEEIEELERVEDSNFKFVEFAIDNAYMNGIYDGKMLEMKEENERFKTRWENEYKLSNSPKTDLK